MKCRLCRTCGCLAVIAGVVILSICLAPRALGINAYQVLTGSMAPGIPAGSVVYTRHGTDFATGDVIAYDYGGMAVIHRIANILPDGNIITKGDANLEPDPEPVSKNNIMGSVIFIIPGPAADRLYSLVFAAGGLAVLMGACLIVSGRAMKSKRGA